MVVKSDAESISFVYLLFGLTIVLMIMCFRDGDFWGLFPLWIFMFVFIISHWMVIGRTLRMDEQGCSVCFLCYRKRYQWEELQVKSVEYHDHDSGLRLPYTGGIVFIAKGKRGPRKLYDLLDYNSSCPFSSFFVFFRPEEPVDKWTYYKGVYEVDKEQFMKKLEEWRVEIQEVVKC